MLADWQGRIAAAIFSGGGRGLAEFGDRGFLLRHC